MEPAPEPEPFFPATYVKASLFDDEPEQLTLAAPSPRKPSAAKKPRVVRPVVPLKDIEDWLEFAESVLGRQDIPADSLASHFTTLSDLSGHEDQLQIYMGMDPFQLLGRALPLARHRGRHRRPARLLPLGTPIRPGLRRWWLRPPARKPPVGPARLGRGRRPS